MRSVFVRMRERRLEAPAWAGGLKYDDTSRPQSARTHKEHEAATPSQGRLSSAIASGMQTRLAMTPRRDVQVNSGGMSGIDGSRSTDRVEVGDRAMRNRNRPSTSGGFEQRSDTKGGASTERSKRTSRPITADARTPRSRLSLKISGQGESRRGSAMSRQSIMDFGSHHPGGATDGAHPLSARNAATALLVPKKTGPTFHTLFVKILGIKGLAHALADNYNRIANSETDSIMYAVMVLNVEGITHHSKPVRMQNQLSVMVPDELFEFELQANVLGTLLSIKVYKLLRHDGSHSHQHQNEIGSAYMELASALHCGGHRIAVCKLSNDAFVGSVGEAQFDVKLKERPLDFSFSYTGDNPVFRKAGYTITPGGIVTMPQQYKIHGLPKGETIRTLQMEKFVADEVQGLQVWRAKDAKGHSYTIKRFSLTEFDPRRMLVNEMDGLIDSLPHQAITPLNAFLDRLEVVLVLDNMDGRYLRDVIAVKGKVPEQNASIVLRQVLQAVRYLHESKLRVHNDIDARNILVLKSGEVRLGGFCYSTRNVGASQKFAGPYIHMSPERLLGLDCGYASDSWSVGILGMELLLGRPPYDMDHFNQYGANALFEFKKLVVTEPSPSIKRGDDYSDEVRLFVDSCLHKNLKLRLSVAGLLSHPFITKYESFMPNFLGRWMSKEKKKKGRSLMQEGKNSIFSMLADATQNPIDKFDED